MGAGGGDCEAMRAELLRPGLSGGRGNNPPGWTATGVATARGLTAGFSTFAGATGLALVARGFDSDLAADFGMDLITDLVSGLASLPGIPALAGTGLATACLLTAEVTDLAEDFLASGLTAEGTFFRAGLAAADLDDGTGLDAGLAVDLTGGLADFAGLATGLPGLATGFAATFCSGLAFTALFTLIFKPLPADGFAVVLDRVFAGAFAVAAGFFFAVLAAAFMIGLLSKSASL